MTEPTPTPPTLQTPNAKFPLQQYHLPLAGRDWTILHTGMMLTADDEMQFFEHMLTLLPYGVALWPASIALAYEIGSRSDAWQGRTVLELGAGTGLPGIVAASLGARVTQTDYQEIAMSVCRLNGQENGIGDIEYRLVDWADWRDERQYDWIIGADILYRNALHPCLRHIFETNLAPGGRVLLSDPLRKPCLAMFDTLGDLGWDIDITKWELGMGDEQRTVATFELSPPPAAE